MFLLLFSVYIYCGEISIIHDIITVLAFLWLCNVTCIKGAIFVYNLKIYHDVYIDVMYLLILMS